MPSLSAAEAAALLAIEAGARNERELAALLNTDQETARRLVERLRRKGLVDVEEKRLLFVKRRRIRITERGLEALPEAKRLLLAEYGVAVDGGGRRRARGAPGEGFEVGPPVSPVLAPLALLSLLLGAGLLGASLAEAVEEAGSDDEEDGGVIYFDPEEWV